MTMPRPRPEFGTFGSTVDPSSNARSERPASASWRAWWLAIRPKTLSAGAVPVLVGTACAYQAGSVNWAAAAAAFTGALFIQIGANLANDVFDYKQGVDTIERVGPTRVVQAGLLSIRQVTVGMAIAFALATLAGTYLVSAAGAGVVAIGLLSILSAIAYTAGPYPLGYHGLGDVFVVVFFGFVAVVGTAWVAFGSVPTVSWIAAVPPGALSTAVLVVNNIRDRESDERTGKRTLAVTLGRRGAFFEYLGLIALAYAAPCVIVLIGLGRTFVLLPWATLPLAVAVARRVAVDEGAKLNGSLVATARLLLFFGILFSIGLAQGPAGP